ncbi:MULTISPECIES: SGNH/GDSL hydrolase family protein [Bacillus]|uniref:SGNH hydrolase-type esterase domain-containing protein n=2 Tax=Bacillus TaxID=1386 RepID=A0A0M5JLD8_9BACI|nr:hypothetical protein AM592_06825 [Bacillus gobiensis]MBP1080354.1 lysophospholipase L1-like esterase [Bacillus capparidis]
MKGRLMCIPMILVLLLSACNIEQTIEEKVQNPKTIEKKNIKIAAIGDSLTQGVGDESGKGYVGMVVDQLKKEENVGSVSVDNFAVKGHRTVDTIKKLKEVQVQNGIKEADIILMTIGGNDLMRVVRQHFLDLTYEPFQIEQNNYRSHLTEILSTVRKLNSDADIVYVGLYNPFKFTLSEIKEFDEIIEDWNAAAAEEVSKDPNVKHVRIEDLFAEYSDEKKLSEDEFHPNEKGYTLIADRVYNDAVKKILP